MGTLSQYETLESAFNLSLIHWLRCRFHIGSYRFYKTQCMHACTAHRIYNAAGSPQVRASHEPVCEFIGRDALPRLESSQYISKPNGNVTKYHTLKWKRHKWKRQTEPLHITLAHLHKLRSLSRMLLPAHALASGLTG